MRTPLGSSQKSYYPMYLANLYGKPKRKDWSTFITDVHAFAGKDHMVCSDEPAFPFACDCAVNAKMMLYLLSGKELEGTSVPTKKSNVFKNCRPGSYGGTRPL